MTTIKEFNEAYLKRDIDRALALLAPDPDSVFIGTGADERRIGLAEMKTQLERDFAQSETGPVISGAIVFRIADPIPVSTILRYVKPSAWRSKFAYLGFEVSYLL